MKRPESLGKIETGVDSFVRGVYNSNTFGGVIVSATMQSLGIDRLPREEQLALISDIWDHLVATRTAESGSFLTPAQREDLRRRIAEDDANPDDAVPWEEARKILRAVVGR